MQKNIVWKIFFRKIKIVKKIIKNDISGPQHCENRKSFWKIRIFLDRLLNYLSDFTGPVQILSVWRPTDYRYLSLRNHWFFKFRKIRKFPCVRPSPGSNFRQICSVAALPRNFIRQMTRRAYLRRLRLILI